MCENCHFKTRNRDFSKPYIFRDPLLVISTWIHMEIFMCHYNGRVYHLDISFLGMAFVVGTYFSDEFLRILHSNGNLFAAF